MLARAFIAIPFSPKLSEVAGRHTSWKTPIHRDKSPRRRRLRHTRSRQIISATASSEGNNNESRITDDELAIAHSAVRATCHLFNASIKSCWDEGLPQLSTADLLSFCSVKGVKLNTNIWNRSALLHKARIYYEREGIARTQPDKIENEEWLNKSTGAKIRDLHDVCNGEGDATYVDPVSGYTVFSAFAHLKRGHCCGLQKKETQDGDGEFERTHRCRHCPYMDNGAVGGSSMQALKERLHVVEYVRSKVQEQWQKGFSVNDEAEKLEDASTFSFSALTDDIEANITNSNDSNQTKETDAEERERKRLRRKLVKKVEVEKRHRSNDFTPSCDVCSDERMVTCGRCKGFTWVFSPDVRICPRCKGEGMHPCMDCTPYRPPPTTSIYS